MINPSPTLTEADFRKSSYSDPNMQCVHVARREAQVALRDSKTVFDTSDDRRLVLIAERFDAFLTQYRR